MPGKDHHTPCKVAFFRLYDQSKDCRSFRSICREKGVEIPPSTGHRWLGQRDKLGSQAMHRTRCLGRRPGPRYRIDDQTLQNILDPETQLHWKTRRQQAEELGVSRRAITRNISTRSNAKQWKENLE